MSRSPGISCKDLNFVRNIVIDNIPDSFISPSKIHGFGLFAARPFVPDEILCVLDGQKMLWDCYDKIDAALRDEVKALVDYFFMEWNSLDTDTLLVRPFRTKYSYINHSRLPNLKLLYDPLRVVVCCHIEDKSEFLIDYRCEPLRATYLQGPEGAFL